MKTKWMIKMLAFALLGIIASCIKDEVSPLGNKGTTLIKFNDGPQKAYFFSPFADEKKVNVFNFRRDPNSNSELQKPATITITAAPDVVTKYNDDNNETYELLPESFYTFDNDEGVTMNGDDFTFNFAAGEFAKNVNVVIDGSQWTDLSKKYALAFVVSNTDGYNLSVEKDTMITFFSIKNEWEGIYSVESGTVTRYTAPLVPESPSPLSGSLAGNPDVILSTAGQYTLSVPIAGVTGCLKWTGGVSSVGGIDGLTFTIDPVTNLVTAASESNATLANWDGHENKYDPVTKTFYLAFKWNPLSNVREYEIVLKFKEPLN